MTLGGNEKGRDNDTHAYGDEDLEEDVPSLEAEHEHTPLKAVDAAFLDSDMVVEEMKRVALAALGHEVEEIKLEKDDGAIAKAFVILTFGEIRAFIDESAKSLVRRVSRREFETLTWVIYLLGKQYCASEFSAALNLIQHKSREIGVLFEDYEVVLTPTLAKTPVVSGALLDLLDASFCLVSTGVAHEAHPFCQINRFSASGPQEGLGCQSIPAAPLFAECLIVAELPRSTCSRLDRTRTPSSYSKRYLK